MRLATRLGAIELHYVKTDDAGFSNGNHMNGSSDRFVIKPISPEKFRSFITDMDWTQMHQRQGTFTLQDQKGQQNQRGVSPRSRIPTPRVRSAIGSGGSGGGSGPSSSVHEEDEADDGDEESTYNNDTEVDGDPSEALRRQLEVNRRLRGLVKKLSATLNTVLDADSAMRNNLHSLQTTVHDMQNIIED